MTDEKQTPSEWAWRHEITVLDPDGWRRDGKDFHEPITEDEFNERAVLCTVQLKKKGTW